MGSGCNILSTAIFSFAWLLSPSLANTDTFPVDSKGPDAVITSNSGVGTSNAAIAATISKQSVVDWCDNWQPGEVSCLQNMQEYIGKTYTASADCDAGTMTDPAGTKLQWTGLNRGPDFNRYFEFTDVETGKTIGFSNADGGVELMAQWMSLCPYGLPYSELPKSSTIDLNRLYPRLRDRGIVQLSELVGHNGSMMELDKDLGAIVYVEPKFKSIVPNTVLFRGFITFEPGLPTQGMAYVFKKGCEPQPYRVEGYYGNDGGNRLILRGEAPIWDGCNVSGYTSESKNAELVFDLFE